jgi:cohesin complex subunit SA-1/2
VATRQYEAALGGKKDSRLSKKASSFRQQMDSLKRTKADLEEIVSSSIIHGVFMHRFRDSNLYIRATTLKSLSRMTIQRPDLFLVDKYLKYFGWMVSDKAASVRVAGLEGLHAPFLALEQKKTKSSSRKNPIDLQQMVNVVTKFLPKIADCVLDTNYVVQEKAMSLLLSLEREGFLDEVMDDNLWMQINLKALSPQTTPAVRRDALYFVMDQLEAFDEDEDEKSGQKRRRSKDKASLAESSERMMVQRIDALASWYDIRVFYFYWNLFLQRMFSDAVLCCFLLSRAGEILVDGPIPVDKIRVHLADYMVQSLREMPKHKALVTNWNAMLRAIGDDGAASTGGKAENRAEVAKQRVLVQMLARAAQAEVVAVSQDGFLERDVDPDEANVEAEENAVTVSKAKKAKGKSKTYSGSMAHESLSISLLSSLPDLLIKFKGDPTILGSITLLPRYICKFVSLVRRFPRRVLVPILTRAFRFICS